MAPQRAGADNIEALSVPAQRVIRPTIATMSQLSEQTMRAVQERTLRSINLRPKENGMELRDSCWSGE